VNRKEAMDALCADKKVRLSWWGQGSYVYLPDEGTIARYHDGSEADIGALLILNPEGWENYTPVAELSPSDVGRAVRLRNGVVTMIITYFPDGNEFVGMGYSWTKDGYCRSRSEQDIMELLKERIEDEQ
jgi:hypothetical protein